MIALVAAVGLTFGSVALSAYADPTGQLSATANPTSKDSTSTNSSAPSGKASTATPASDPSQQTDPTSAKASAVAGVVSLIGAANPASAASAEAAPGQDTTTAATSTVSTLATSTMSTLAGPPTSATPDPTYTVNPLTFSSSTEYLQGAKGCTQVTRVVMSGLADTSLQDQLNSQFRAIQDALAGVTYWNEDGSTGSDPTSWPVTCDAVPWTDDSGTAVQPGPGGIPNYTKFPSSNVAFDLTAEIEANFSNVLSLQSSLLQPEGRLGGSTLVAQDALNVRLDTGQSLTSADLFTDDADIAGMIESAAQNDRSCDATCANTKASQYRADSQQPFSFTADSATIMGVTIDFASVQSKVAIFDKYAAATGLYTESSVVTCPAVTTVWDPEYNACVPVNDAPDDFGTVSAPAQGGTVVAHVPALSNESWVVRGFGSCSDPQPSSTASANPTSGTGPADVSVTVGPNAASTAQTQQMCVMATDPKTSLARFGVVTINQAATSATWTVTVIPVDGSIVATTQPGFSGMVTTSKGAAVANQPVGVYFEDPWAPICQATTNSQGKWSCAPTVSLAQGPNKIEVTATTYSSDGSVLTYGQTNVTITVKGSSTWPTAPSVTTANGTQLAGTAQVGTTVTLTYPQNGGRSTSITAVVNAQGTWSVHTPSDAVDGVLAAVAQDDHGQMSDTTFADLDVTAPDPPVVLAANGSQISGTAEAGSHVTATYADGTVVAETTADSTGAWLMATPDNMVPGTIQLTATDAAGNQSQPTSADLNSTIPQPDQVTVTLSDTEITVGHLPCSQGPDVSPSSVTATILVSDQSGQPLARQVVDVTVDSPLVVTSGSATVTTDANGTAQVTLTVDPASATTSGAMANVNAAVEGSSVAGSAAVEIGVIAALELPPAQVRLDAQPTIGSDVLADGLASWTLNAQLFDACGIAQAQTAVHFAVTGSAKLSSSSATTDSTGLASVTVTDTVGEAVDASATSVGFVPASPVSIAFAQTSGDIDPTISTLAVTQDSGIAADGVAQQTATFTARDSNNVPVVGASVTLAWRHGQKVGVTGMDGTVSVPVTSLEVGQLDITATGTKSDGTTWTLTASTAFVAPAAGHEPTFSVSPSPLSMEAGGTAVLLLTALDGNGQPADYDASYECHAMDGSPCPFQIETVLPIRGGSGKASFTTDQVGVYILSVYSETAQGDKAADFTGSPILVTVGNPAVQGPTIDKASAAGLSGTTPVGTTVMVTYSRADGTTNQEVVPPSVDGTWSMETPADAADGPVQAQWSIGGIPTTKYWDLTPPAAPVVKAADETQIAGTAEALSWIVVKDSKGVVVGQTTADENGVWVIPTPDSAVTMKISVTATDSAGNESQPTVTDLVIQGTPGSLTVTLSATTIHVISVACQDAPRLDPDSVTATVTVTDTTGLRLAGQTVEVKADAPFVIVSGPSKVTTDANGVATVTLGLDVSQDNWSTTPSVTATVVGTDVTNSTVAAVSVEPADQPQPTLTLTPQATQGSSGDGATEWMVSAQLMDGCGAPVANGAVQFAATGSARLSVESAVTTADGYAKVTVTDSVAESVQVTATVANSTVSSQVALQFVAKPTPAPTISVTLSNGTIQLYYGPCGEAPVVSPTTVNATFLVVDATGAPMPGQVVDVAVDDPLVINSGSSQVTTDAAGTAQISLGLDLGSYKIGGDAMVNATVDGTNVTGAGVVHMAVSMAQRGPATMALSSSADSGTDVLADGQSTWTVVAQVMDICGSPAAGENVEFSATGQAQVPPLQMATGVDGKATIKVTDDVPELVQVSASIPNTRVSAGPVAISFIQPPVSGAPVVRVEQADRQFTFTATGFAPGEMVSAQIHSTTIDLPAQKADTQGSVTFTWTAPADFDGGSHEIVLTAASGSNASYTFTVPDPGSTGPTSGATSSSGPDVDLPAPDSPSTEPNVGNPGSQVTPPTAALPTDQATSVVTPVANGDNSAASSTGVTGAPTGGTTSTSTPVLLVAFLLVVASVVVFGLRWRTRTSHSRASR
ncbi:MAG: Ig-like domain-containing protein [Propionibacteriaceae bacterium]|nr:Ig-like domain-containing protein [Propionibacteriaceae bacterium]